MAVIRDSGFMAQATNSSPGLRLLVSAPFPHTNEGCWVSVPARETGWKYEPFGPAGSSPKASNCAAM